MVSIRDEGGREKSMFFIYLQLILHTTSMLDLPKRCRNQVDRTRTIGEKDARHEHDARSGLRACVDLCEQSDAAVVERNVLGSSPGWSFVLNDLLIPRLRPISARSVAPLGRALHLERCSGTA